MMIHIDVDGMKKKVGGSMLRVKTKTKKSNIHGIGLFADQYIKKGTLIWEFVEGFDMKFTEEEFEKLPRPTRDYIRNCYGWKNPETGLIYLSGDEDRYVNHSYRPNMVNERAAKNIKKGEELTEDYFEFDLWTQESGKI
jgi:SET domain-containing protein